MTLQEERDALQKRMDEIDAEIAGFVPGWYVCWSGDTEEYFTRIEKISALGILKTARNLFDRVKPFHLVAHKFLPEGWQVVGPEPKTLYDWSQAPEWANWAATDKDGSVYWFKVKPELGLGRYYDSWWTNKRWERAIRSTALHRSVPWDQSIEQRP